MYLMVFFDHIVLMKLDAYRILSLASQIEIYSLPVMWKLVWHRLVKSHFIQHHTFQHCLDMFKLNKCAKYLNFAINNQPLCTKACKIIALSLSFTVISSFPHLLTCEANMLHRSEGEEKLSYYIVTYSEGKAILPHSNLLTILLCLGNYEQCCTQLLKVVH